ncbi:hypothetical protein PISMIDRAFT_78150, partial [Pisolithus microcarpus 441]
TKAFQQLKQVLMSEPVLRAPRFDGTPFILTTDGCKDGFGDSLPTVVLAQHFEMTLAGGQKVTVVHPIGFASK